jgi:hypothetical protein
MAKTQKEVQPEPEVKSEKKSLPENDIMVTQTEKPKMFKEGLLSYSFTFN